MAPLTPTTTPHGSTTANNHPHPMSPTVTDILSQAFFRTWSERVVAASLDVWSMYPTDWVFFSALCFSPLVSTLQFEIRFLISCRAITKQTFEC
eukprot:scaffold415835_cov51-Attheya_sp.AAC.1